MSFISTYRPPESITGSSEEPRPFTELEKLFARELQYAASEMESLRQDTQNPQLEPRLHTAYTHASRNWRRAQRELSRLQAARVGRAARYTPEIQRVALAAPLAEPSGVPMPKEPVAMQRHILDLIGKGIIRTDIFSFIRQLDENSPWQ